MRDTIERNKQKMYSTGEIAKLCGITVRTVQYYDQRGLLIPTELSEDGRRMYTSEDVEKLRLLIYLRSLGLSIDDIASIYQQDNGENIIKALIDERIFAIEKEVEEQKIKLQDAKSFREQLKVLPVITPASMPNIAYILKRKERLKHYRIQLLIIGIIVGIIQGASLVYSLFSGKWWIYLVFEVLVIIFGSILFKKYMHIVAYICPECHTVFRPNGKEVFWARHTYRTRKLTCPCCNKKGFCVETLREEDL